MTDKAQTPPSFADELPDDFCKCGYRQSAHPTVAGCKAYNRSVTFNMQVSDPDFEKSARLFRDASHDKTKKRR